MPLLSRLPRQPDSPAIHRKLDDEQFRIRVVETDWLADDLIAKADVEPEHNGSHIIWENEYGVNYFKVLLNW